MVSFYETFLISGIVFIWLFEIYRAYRSKNKVEIFAPPFFFATLFLIYTIIGPLVFLYYKQDLFLTFFTRDFYEKCWEGALVALSSFYIAYLIPSKRKIQKRTPKNRYIFNKSSTKPNAAFFVASNLYLFGYAIYFISNPAKAIANLNPLKASGFGVVDEGTWGGYAAGFLNFLIPALVLMLVSMTKKTKWLYKVLFIVFFIVAFLTFTALGFRYRLVCTLVGMIGAFYIYRNKTPSLSNGVLLTLVLFSYISIVVATRSYGSGVDLSKLQGKNDEILFNAFQDANIFPISGAAMTAVPDLVNYAYFKPITGAILLPIPRTWYPTKDIDSYFRDAISAYGILENANAHKWGAITYYAEWYIAFSWLGIIMFSVVLGRFYKRLWIKTMNEQDNLFVITQYACFYFLLFLIFSRGSFSFIVQSFFFTVYPSFFIQRYNKAIDAV